MWGNENEGLLGSHRRHFYISMLRHQQMQAYSKKQCGTTHTNVLQGRRNECVLGPYHQHFYVDVEPLSHAEVLQKTMPGNKNECFAWRQERMCLGSHQRHFYIDTEPSNHAKVL